MYRSKEVKKREKKRTKHGGIYQIYMKLKKYQTEVVKLLERKKKRKRYKLKERARSHSKWCRGRVGGGVRSLPGVDFLQTYIKQGVGK
jgi:hypothetical protein